MSCEEPWPSDITLNQRERTLELVWDGAAAALGHSQLRAACRCSHCESGRRINGAAPTLAHEVRLTRIEMLGSTGLQLFFSDGHERGIYPWAYLHQLAFDTTERISS